MHPRQSKMEFMVLAEVNKLRRFPVTDKEFCLVSTWPDQYYHEAELAVYIDQIDVHAKREDKDGWLREQLKKRYQLRDVLEFPYKRANPKQARQFALTIDERIKEISS